MKTRYVIVGLVALGIIGGGVFYFTKPETANDKNFISKVIEHDIVIFTFNKTAYKAAQETKAVFESQNIDIGIYNVNLSKNDTIRSTFQVRDDDLIFVRNLKVFQKANLSAMLNEDTLVESVFYLMQSPKNVLE